MEIELTSDVLAALLAEAKNAHPLECCGILLGSDDRIDRMVAAPNVHPSPARHFEIDPQTLIDCHRDCRNAERKVVGYYHSHPNGVERPSGHDLELAARDGTIWAIVATGRVSLWRSGDAGFEALPYVVVPR